jgi:hypothetical protein
MSRISNLRQSKNSRPTSNNSWSEGSFGASTVRVPRGEKSFKSDAPPIQVIRPQWNGPSPVTFRPFPMFYYDNPELLDHGRTESSTGWSDWVRYQVPTAHFVGKDEKFTFILYDPRDKSTGYDPYTNPYNKLYWGVTNACKAQQAIVGGHDVFTKFWPGLVDPNNYKTRCLTRPTSMNYYQGFVYEYSERRGEDWEVRTPIADGLPLGANPDDLTPIIQIKNSAAKSLDEQLNYMDGADMVWEDPVSLTDGPFISFFNPKKHGDLFEDYEQPQGDSNFIGWGAHASDSFLYTHKRQTQEVSNDISDLEATVRDRILWWDNVLHFPTHEEICLLLAQAFKSMPDLLRYCWQDDPEFFTKDVEKLLGDRTTTTVESPFDEEEEKEETPAPRPRQKSRSSAIPPASDSDFEDEDDDDLFEDDDDQESASSETDDLSNFEEEESLDDSDLFDEDEEDVEAEEAAKRRSRLRSPKRKATPRRRS